MVGRDSGNAQSGVPDTGWSGMPGTDLHAWPSTSSEDRRPSPSNPRSLSRCLKRRADVRELTWQDVQPVDVIGLEVGYRLIPLVDREVRAGS